MKKIFSFLFFIVNTFTVSAQELSIPDPSTTVIPPSPTAAALAVYGEIPVGMYTGIPNISQPITQLSGRHLSLPISLNYHSGGVKLDALAGWTGLGWSLSAGGVITRSVRGLEDNTSQGYKNNPVINQIQNGILDFSTNSATIEQMAQGNWDGELDVYHFNVLSYSGSFVIDQSNEVHLIPHQDLKIEQQTEGVFYLTIPDGTTFTFDVVEMTSSSTDTNGNNSAGICEGPNSPTGSSHISAWYLSKIEDANGTDEISLTYAPSSNLLQYETGISATKYFDGVGGGDCRIAPDDTECVQTVSTAVQQLSSIESAYGKVNFVASSNRMDGGGSQLDEIHLFGADKTTLLKKWNLTYDYFTSTGSECTAFPERCKRLKLTAIQTLPGDASTTAIPPHTFTYLDEVSSDYQLNPRLSYGQDHWGFNNGVTNNPNMLPAYIFREQDYLGANRDTDSEKVKAGLLYQIHYPTGGYRQLDFEVNSINTTGIATDFLTASSNTVAKSVEVIANQTTTTPVADSETFTIPHDAYITIPILIGNNTNGIEWNGRFTLVDAEGNDYCISSSSSIPCAPDNALLNLPFLRAGTYTLTAETLVNGDFSQMKISWNEHERTEQVTNEAFGIAVGGTRIKKITAFDQNDQVLNTQAYQYTQHEDATKSSGKLITLPNYAYLHQEYRNTSLCASFLECSFSALTSSSKAPLGTSQGSPVCYPEVTMLYGANGEGGRTQFTYSFAGDKGGTGFPFAHQTSYEWKRGLLLEQKDYAADNLITPVHSITNTYNFRTTETLHNNSLTNLKIGYRILGNTCQTTANFNCTEDNVDKVFYGNCAGFLGLTYFVGLPKTNNTGVPVLSLLTNNCEVVAYHPCYDKPIGTQIPNPDFEQQFAYRTYETISQWYFLEKTVEVTDGVSVVREYDYDEVLGRHTQPTQITLTNSDGKKHQTRMTYIPEDADNNVATAIAMENRYMIGLPVKSEKYVQQNGSSTWDFQGAISINYAHFQPNGTSQYHPRRYNEILSNSIGLERLQLYEYTEDGFFGAIPKKRLSAQKLYLGKRSVKNRSI